MEVDLHIPSLLYKIFLIVKYNTKKTRSNKYSLVYYLRWTVLESLYQEVDSKSGSRMLPSWKPFLGPMIMPSLLKVTLLILC